MDDHVDAPADSWMGWSNGRWEGETLVVDTTGFNDMTWFDRAGNFHSDAMHVVERITLAQRGYSDRTKPRSRIRTCSRGLGK